MFQTFAMRLDGKVGKPGTGNEMFDDSADLVRSAIHVSVLISFSAKRQAPNGFMVCFDVQARTATVEATASFRQRRPAFARTTSLRTLSDNFTK